MSKRRVLNARRAGLIGSVLLVAACIGPIEPEQGVLNEDAASLLRVAESTRAAGDAAAAIPLYQRAAKLAPESAAPLIALGDTLNSLRAYTEASEAWTRALTLEPKNVAALGGYGTTLTGLNQPHLALAKFQAALAISPEPGLYNGIGVVQDMLGQADAAQASYRAGLQRNPNSLSLANNLGLSLALSGRYADAIATLERAVSLPGATVRHRQNLALAYGLAGETEKAARTARLDLDEQRVLQNLGYYQVLKSMSDHAQKVAAVGSLGTRQSLATPAEAVALAPRRSAPRQVAAEFDLPTGLATAAAPLEIEPENVTALGAPQPLVGRAVIQPAAVEPEVSVWRVQVGALASRATAKAEWGRIQRAHTDLLGELTLRLQQTTHLDGTLYRIQAGPLGSRVAARSLCAELKAREQGCLVVRP